MVVVANLLGARGVLVVGLLARDLLEHLHEVHVHARIALDEVLELLDGRRELGRVLVDVLRHAMDELAVHAVVGREPRTRPRESSMVNRDVVIPDQLRSRTDL